ncbi:MAG TPA: quinoprotein relay system zinc metallohydrolase 2 [Casimicrobiaceae bacterium]|nr:quinoprotein relay system zinc metallohydrolase 2 [Casimicrobiaceae bacterium]
MNAARRLSSGPCWLLAVLAIFCAVRAPAATDATDFALENPAPGVYVHYGVVAEMSRANAGDVANMGFVVGSRCVAVIDTGGTYAVGHALREAIRRTTPLPICYVVNTHGHPDHVFGNAAFVADHPEFVGHARLADALQRRAPNYLKALYRDLGNVAEGSTIVLPSRSVVDTLDLDLGDRILTLRAWPTAHTDCDLTVLDRGSGTLWLGDLLFVEHLPVLDGNLRGFLAAIEALRLQPAARAIAGHGRAGAWPQALDAEERYLRGLQRDVRAAIRKGLSLSQTLAASTPPADPGWQLVGAFHRRNVTAAYAELEWSE